MHEFSVLEYYVRSYLAHLLATQQDRPLATYEEQFNRFIEFISHREIELNPKVLENPDVRWMDAELTVAEIRSFNNCLDQLRVAAEKANFSKMKALCPLVEELKEANRQRNTLTHSVWHGVEGEIVMQNFPAYHKGKWMYINGSGERLTPHPSEKWTLQQLENFAAHLHDLCERLEKIFQG